MTMQVPLWKVGVLLVATWLIFAGPKGCTLPSIAAKVDAVTYVHVVKGVVPGPVTEAINELNRKGIIATPYPADTEDGAGEIPEQYKIPNSKAKEAGLPSAVATAKGKFVRLVKDPKTKAQMLEAAK